VTPSRPSPGPAKRKATTATAPKGTVIMPVPTDAPPPPAEHPTLGAPIATWRYTDAAGRLLGLILRFDPAGGKEFRTLTLWRVAGGKFEWCWKSWPAPRPLYGLQGLADRPTAPVLVCEGERAADAAMLLLPGFVVVTSPNGSKSAGKADWSPLKAREITIWRDADAAGLDYARDVAKLVTRAGAEFVSTSRGRGRGAEVSVALPPSGVADGWDAADALAEGWTTERAAALVAAAVPAEEIPDKKAAAGDKTGDASPGGGRKRTPQRDVLMGLTDSVELWHDANRAGYASFPVNGHHEHWPVRSRDFRMWLSGEYYEKTGEAIGGQALEDGIRILEARAVNRGPQHECFTRIGHAAGAMFLDLADASWRAVEITAAGYSVIENPPLKLLRSASMRPLPAPEPGSLIEELRRFVNVKTDTDFMLVIAWLVAALRHCGPFTILGVNGEAGSGKSFFTRILRSLVDPSAAPIRAVPRDDRDLVVSASSSWVLCFDNLSSVPAWLADALCRLATGSGFATRMLHTDRDEMIFDAARPIIINGIPTLTDRADLADRAVTIHLRAIAENERRPEDELLADFEKARPRILGALLDAVSRAIGNIDTVKLDRVPRMADFVKWIVAAEPGLGWEPGAFLTAYGENRRDVSEATFEADEVAVVIWKLITTERAADGFEGTATELLEAINNLVSEATLKKKYWPQNPAQLGNRVARAAPLLKAKGCIVERRHSGTRIINIVPPPEHGF
jgi:putative DNA primase/helicase